MAADAHGENVFDVIVGTYEEFVVGYSFERTKDYEYALRQTFTNHSHLGAVRCIAAGGRYVASGSSDETIKLFNMQKKAEMGTLMQHNGNITDLQFFHNSHLLSASEDNDICVWSTGSWQCLKTLKGHKRGVVSLSVHPSGKLLLSVSKDKTLRTWNLITGRTAFVTNLSPFPELVCWSPLGTYFVVAINNNLDVYLTKKAAKIHTIDFGKKISCVAFITDYDVVIGGEGGNMETHNVKKKSVYGMFAAHSDRVKAAQVVLVEDYTMLVTASSSGEICVWDVEPRKLDETPWLRAKTDSGCRITCMAVYKPTEVVAEPQKKKKGRQEKGKYVEDEDSADDDESDEERHKPTVAKNEPKKQEKRGQKKVKNVEDEDEEGHKPKEVKNKSKQQSRSQQEKDKNVEEDDGDEESDEEEEAEGEEWSKDESSGGDDESIDEEDDEEEVDDEEGESDDEEELDEDDEGDSESSDEEVEPQPKRRKLQNGRQRN